MGQEHNINEHQRGMTHYPLVAYHGTSKEAAERIMRDGLRPSDRGVDGPGIYTAATVEGARKIAWEKEDPAIVRVIIHPHNPVSTTSGYRDQSGRLINHRAEDLPEHDVWESRDRYDGPTRYLVSDPSAATPLDVLPDEH